MQDAITISPSDLTFLWEECPRCFYLKVMRKFSRPSMPFPKIFTRIDGLMKTYFQERSTHEFSQDLPAGSIRFKDQWVVSRPITMGGQTTTLTIRGKFDCVVNFEDGTYGVVDFKTSEARPEHIPFYSRQLHAYTHALEYPAPMKLGLSPVTRMGLFVVEPTDMIRLPDGRIAYIGNVTWQECPRDDRWFYEFLGDILNVLEQPEPPLSGEACTFCKYREASRLLGY